MVRLAGSLKELTEPRSIDFLEKAAELPGKIEVATARPTGPIGFFVGFQRNGGQRRPRFSGRAHQEPSNPSSTSGD